MFGRLKRGGWPYGHPPNVPFEINRDSPQADGLVLWLPWGGGTPGAHRHVERIKGLAFTEGGTPVWVSDGERGWSVLFDDVASERLTAGSPILSAAPMTVMAWVLPDAAVSEGVFTIRSTWQHEFALMLSNAGEVRWRATEFVAGTAAATAGRVLSAWNHVTGVEYASDSRACFLNGGNKGTDVTDLSPAGMTDTGIGYAVNVDYFSGRIMDVRVYDAAKTDAEVHQVPANPWELWRPLVRRVWVAGGAAETRVAPGSRTFAVGAEDRVFVALA